jgi:UDP-N-acetylglucosamine--N-acetylmuramyl-(pentapeptide) pyrophosphoryl-undecaprenol N-acetylglucosamine transferase
VYPALAVVEALLDPNRISKGLPSLTLADLLWIGSKGGIEAEMVQKAGIKFSGLEAGGLRGMGPVVKGRNALRIAGSIRRARAILTKFQPDVVLVTGGYACVSVSLAARRIGLPILIYLPDIVPGQAIRFLSRFADQVAVTSEESYQHLRRDKVVVTGYPVRRGIFDLDEVAAQQSLGLDPDQPVLLVFGGSRGARSINRAIVASLQDLLPVCQVVHISGRLDADWVAGLTKRLPEELKDRYQHHEYVHDMPRFLVAADLVVARAGAATMGEFPAAGLPAILVPYPYSGQHQMPNAEYMERNGAARLLLDDDLESGLTPTILTILKDAELRLAMEESARAMVRADAADRIAEQLWIVARRQAESGPGEVRP